MSVTIKRIFKSGWQNFSRDGGIAVATIFILIIAIFLIASIFLFRDISRFLVNAIQEKVDISVYFQENSSEEDILNVKEKLSKILEVKGVEYVSKDKALEDFRERHKDNPTLIEALEAVGTNPFLASLNIQAWDASQYGKIADFLADPSFKDLIERVDYFQRKPAIERIFSLSSLLEKTGISISIILVITAILVTFNTVRLAILNSGEEIKIQRLVGASNWFIRGPFLVQGLIAGVISAFGSLLILSLLCWFLSPKIEFFFSGLNIFNLFLKNFWVILAIQILSGILLAVVSSAIAIRKYLKV